MSKIKKVSKHNIKQFNTQGWLRKNTYQIKINFILLKKKYI